MATNRLAEFAPLDIFDWTDTEKTAEPILTRLSKWLRWNGLINEVA